MVGKVKKITPVNVKNSHKFSGKNSFFGVDFPGAGVSRVPNIPNSVLNDKIDKNLSCIMDMGLADSTWNKYKTSLNHLRRIQDETGVDMSLPLSDRQLLWFVVIWDPIEMWIPSP